MNLILVFLFILAVRLASVFLIQTYYVPDEYWQSLEVAHKITFGYGYLTWEWAQGIRSYIYPLIIAGLYKLLALSNLDSVSLLVVCPRILQAILSAYSDYRFYVWNSKRKWSLFLILTQWFWFYTGSRTLSNTLETSLTTIALSFFPWQGEGVFYVWIVAFCCFLRPTACIIWLPLFVYHLQKTKLSVFKLLIRFALIGALVVALGVTVDSYWHGELIVTPFEFLTYNIFNNIGSFYGSHPWHWYFTNGLPVVLGVNTLWFILSAIDTIRWRKAFPVRMQLLISISLTLILLSIIEHKEFRFITYLLPLCLYITTDYLTIWSYKASNKMLWLTTFLIVAGNTLPIWYLGTVHQRGTLDVMPKLNAIAKDYRDENNSRAKFLFLMPCHSTPFYSHIHENVTMNFLTCAPNLSNKPDYKDEAESFYDSPKHWLRSHVPVHPRTAMPSHVILFDTLASKVDEFLKNYKEVKKIPHTEFIQKRTGKNILVFERLKDENLYNNAYDEDIIEDVERNHNLYN